MKIKLIENEGCFAFNMEAENMQDAALLVRLGMNSTNDIRSLHSHAHADGNFTGSVVLGKSKRASSFIPKRP